MWFCNKKFLNELTTGLKEDGFNLGNAASFDFFSNSLLTIYLITLAAAGSGIFLLEKLISFKPKPIENILPNISTSAFSTPKACNPLSLPFTDEAARQLKR
mgnify:CR=1 FL=1